MQPGDNQDLAGANDGIDVPLNLPAFHWSGRYCPGTSSIPVLGLGPVRFSFPGLFRLVLAYFFSHDTIKSAEINRLLNQQYMLKNNEI